MGAELPQQRYLAAVPFFQKLHHRYRMARPQRPQRQAQSGSGFALASAPVKVDKPQFRVAFHCLHHTPML